MKLGQVKIDARSDEDWFEKAIKALADLRPLMLTGNEQQIAEFLEYKRANAGKWQTTGILTTEPPE